jgi:hypothetical protein
MLIWEECANQADIRIYNVYQQWITNHGVPVCSTYRLLPLKLCLATNFNEDGTHTTARFTLKIYFLWHGTFFQIVQIVSWNAILNFKLHYRKFGIYALSRQRPQMKNIKTQ